MVEDTLIPTEKYLKIGCHIGTKFKSGDMKKFLFKTRKDGLKVFDITTIDERIKIAINFLSKFPPEKIVVISRRLYGQTPILKFSEFTGAKALTKRFVPGTFTNPQGKEFVEPAIVIVSEPEADDQAIDEASTIRVPVIGLCSSNNSVKGIDFIVPINNKGRKSLALFFWLAARELLKKKGTIKSDEEFGKEIEDFEYQLKEGAESSEEGRSEENYSDSRRRQQRRPMDRTSNRRQSRY